MTTPSSTTRKRSSSRSSSRPPKAKATQPPKPRWQDWVATRKPEGATRGKSVCVWIERHCVHTNDRWAGKPFRLLLWQRWVVYALFTIGADGLRVVRWSLIGIAKKNGKTELCAALALYFAFGPSGPDGEPEPSALVVCAAGSDAQADLVFGAASTMAKLSPTLSQILEVYEAEILCPSLLGSKIVRVAAAAKKTSSNLDGPNIYVVICDELHCWEGAQAKVVWDTLTNGGVTRRQPMVLQITTAGFDPDSICGQEYAFGQAVVEGKVKAPWYFFWWVEPPEGADHSDPDVIAAANPSYGHIMGPDYYQTQLLKKTENVFRRYFLNQWTTSDEGWLTFGQWEALAIDPKALTFVDAPMYGGTDAATKHDSTAHVRAQWHECREGCPGWNPEIGDARKLRVRARIWERPWDPETRRPVEGWKLPIAEVENELRTYHLDHQLAAWGYDPALFERSAQALEDEGLPMEEIPQAQPLDEPVLTPTGWRAMKELDVGDLVVGADGTSTEITGVYDRGLHRVYRVTFSDGSSTRCTADHRWLTASPTQRRIGSRGTVRTLAQLRVLGLANAAGQIALRFVPTVGPVAFPNAALPVHPYLLGVLLGDGSFTEKSSPRITSCDPAIIDRVRQCLPPGVVVTPHGVSLVHFGLSSGMGARPNPLTVALRQLGLYGLRGESKFIPAAYLSGSVAQRLDLLRGLMDTDGSAAAVGKSATFATTSPGLRDGVIDLVRSLGGVAVSAEMPVRGKMRRRAWKVRVTMPLDTSPFALERKTARLVGRSRPPQRSMSSIEYVGDHAVRCISVASPDGLYVTNDYIVTHNSDARMVPAAQTLYELVQQSRIEHDGDVDFTRHMRAAVAVQVRGGDGGWRLSKGRSKGKMDAAVATAMAAYLATMPAEDADSVYEERGLVTLGGEP